MTELSEREKLIEELEQRMWIDRDIGAMLDSVCDLIIADRKRICAPIADYKKKKIEQGSHWIKGLWMHEAIDETLKLAGLEKE